MHAMIKTNRRHESCLKPSPRGRGAFSEGGDSQERQRLSKMQSAERAVRGALRVLTERKQATTFSLLVSDRNSSNVALIIDLDLQ